MEQSIWNRPEVADSLDEIINSGDKLDLILAQIPSLFGTSEKATYLGFRAVGLNPQQSLEVLGLPESKLEYWRESQPEFLEFERDYLYDLQSRISADIVRLGFLRNMTMFLFQDQTIIQKMLTQGPENMSKRDFDYIRAVRRFYSTQDLLALQKAVQPEKHRNNTLVLSFGGQGYEIVDGDPETLEQLNQEAQEYGVSGTNPD